MEFKAGLIPADESLILWKEIFAYVADAGYKSKAIEETKHSILNNGVDLERYISFSPGVIIRDEVYETIPFGKRWKNNASAVSKPECVSSELKRLIKIGSCSLWTGEPDENCLHGALSSAERLSAESGIRLVYDAFVLNQITDKIAHTFDRRTTGWIWEGFDQVIFLRGSDIKIEFYKKMIRWGIFTNLYIKDTVINFAAHKN